MFFVAGGDFRWQAVFEAIFEGVNMVGDGDILSPPCPHSYLRQDASSKEGVEKVRLLTRSLTWSGLAIFSHPPAPL